MNQNDHHSIRSSLQSLPTLPSGREITYDRCGNSDYNEFDAGSEDLDEGYAAEGEDEAEGIKNHNESMPDIQTNGHEGTIEIDFDDDEGEDLEPNITTYPPVEFMQQDDVSIHIDEDECEASLNDNALIQKSRRSKSRESNRSYRSKSTTDSMEILNLPLSNKEHQLSINQLLGNNYDRLQPNEQSDNDDNNGEYNEKYYQSVDAEDIESEWPGEVEQQVRQEDNTSHRGQKKLTPAKKRRRCILAICLLIFCLGSAGAGIWFVFYYLEDKRGYNIYEFNEGETAVEPNANDVSVTDTPQIIHTIGNALDSQCAPLTVEIFTDNFGNETTWILVYVLDSDKTISQNDNVFIEKKRHADNIKRKRLRPHYIQRRIQQYQSLQSFTVGTGGPYQYHTNSTGQATPYTSTFCLIEGSYQFNIQDANGDGFCCKYGEGSYTLYFPRGRVVHSSSFELGRLESIVFDVTVGDIDTAQITDVPSYSLTPSISSVPSIAPSSNATMVIFSTLALVHH